MTGFPWTKTPDHRGEAVLFAHDPRRPVAVQDRAVQRWYSVATGVAVCKEERRVRHVEGREEKFLHDGRKPLEQTVLALVDDLDETAEHGRAVPVGQFARFAGENPRLSNRVDGLREREVGTNDRCTAVPPRSARSPAETACRSRPWGKRLARRSGLRRGVRAVSRLTVEGAAWY